MTPSGLRLPPERDLPAARAREIRHRVLRPGPPRDPARLRWIAPVASAAAVLVLAVALGSVLTLRTGPAPQQAPGTGDPRVVSPTLTPTTTSPAKAAFRQAPLTAAQLKAAVRRCLTTLGRTEGPDTVTVLGSRRLWTRYGAEDFVSLRTRKGVLLGCLGENGTVPTNIKGSGPSDPSANEPLVHVVGGDAGMATSVDGRMVLNFHPTEVFRADDRVARIQARVNIAGRAGPWFEGVVVGGYAYAAAWLTEPTPNPTGDPRAVRSELRAFDATGAELATPF